ncbi:MAG TPA: LLM class flavin-dependent oxidoreductase, partial [Burkholderiaceae bacterium]
PVPCMDGLWSEAEMAHIDRSLSCSVVGAPATVEAALRAFIDRHRPDELMLTAQIYDHAARKRSFELAWQAAAAASAR